MTSPLISIIVPVYKVEDYLDRCVESIVGQTYRNLEIILVDDGSPDNCPAMCDAWAEKDSRIRVIHKQNGGLSDARNAGMTIATGEWIVFVDSDDVLASRAVEYLKESATDEKTLTTVNWVRFDETVPAVGSNCKTLYVENKQALGIIRRGFFVWGALYSKRVIDELGLFFCKDLKNLEDVHWNLVYCSKIHSVKMSKDPLYYYRRTPNSITSHCIDAQWQLESWIAVRHAVAQSLGGCALIQKKDRYFAFRHCQNNIHAEALAGDIKYSRYKMLGERQSYLSIAPPAERFVIRVFPMLYYYAYINLIRCASWIRRKK